MVEDEVEEVVPEDQPIDELYFTMRTNVVGIQYYKGKCVHIQSFRKEADSRYQGWLAKAKKSGLCANLRTSMTGKHAL